MLKKLAVGIISIGNLFSLNAQTVESKSEIPTGMKGLIVHYSKFESKYVDARNVDVWLPDLYQQDSKKKFAVIYMHDGQNLFDEKLSSFGVDWGIDDAVTSLSDSGLIQPVIVVGIWNTPKRRAEYEPQKAFEMLPVLKKNKIRMEYGYEISGDNYLKFIVEELKPFIDSTYRTKRDQRNTFIMGSSRGAMISVYAICEYPNVFGGSGCLSTHYLASEGIIIDYLSSHLPDPKTHKIYFDYGTETPTHDAQYEPYQKRVDSLMIKRGFMNGKNWLTKKFQGDEHSERSWRKRVHIPLEFLLKTN